jgi:hypothetical protein
MVLGLVIVCHFLKNCAETCWEEKRNELGDKGGKKYSPAKTFEVLDDPSACLSLRLNPFLKCIKCLSVKFHPDSICDSLWSHPQCSFPDTVCIHTRKV